MGIWSPMLISLKVALVATVLCLLAGLPLAWVLAKTRFPGRNLLSALVALPMILPPTVLGYYLLAVLGRRGVVGAFLERTFGFRMVFTWHGAALAAAVVALPLLTRSLQAGFESVDSELEDVARTMGRRPLAVLFTITLPLAWKSLVAGLALAFARAVGEFGATLMIAGNIPGKTQTMAVAIYESNQAGDYARANGLALAISLLVVSLTLLAGHWTGGTWGRRDA